MYPVVLDVRGRRVLVVGGGAVAARKAEALVAEGADVLVVAPDVSDAVARLPVRVERRRYRADDMDDCWLVVTATDDPAVQQQVFDDGRRRHTWVNAADDPQRCSFILPAVHRDGPVIVAVSTSGTSPALAGWLRDRCRDVLPAGIASIAEELGRQRAGVRATGRSTEGLDWGAEIERLVASAEGSTRDDDTTR